MQVRDRFDTLVTRLSRSSVGRSADPYRDIAWGDLPISESDSGLELPPQDPLAQTDWYRSLDALARRRVGLARITTSMTTAQQFENLLQRGLLHRALYMDHDAPEYRYIHHEIIEESQHTLMFAELVHRSGQKPRGMPRPLRRLTEWLLQKLSTLSPIVFFAMVLGGEEPLDMIQRRALAQPDLHPLVRRVMDIHVKEESRHISYAREAIRDEAGRLHPLRFNSVAIGAPIALAVMVRLMLRPNHDLVRMGVPRDVLRAVDRSAAGRAELADGLARVRDLMVAEGLVTPTAQKVWQRLSIW